MTALTQSLFCLVVVTVLVAVATDLRWRTIPDLLTYPAMLIALGVRFYFVGFGDPTSGVFSGVIGLAVCAVWFGFFALRKSGLGWGDVKLAAVVGAAFGIPLIATAVIFISLAGAFQAIVSLIWRGALSDTVRAALNRDASTNAAKKHIPYGVAIAVGSLWAMWWDGNVL